MDPTTAENAGHGLPARARAASRLAAAMAVLVAALPVAAADRPAASQQARGAYLAAIMDCRGCHTPGTLMGKPDAARDLAGSEIGFQVPELGIFYPPNLTSDPETGLGRWSEAEIARAVRTGVRPDGRILAPVMPWHAYAALTDADAAALAGYLKSLPPVRNAVPPLTGPSEAPPAPYFTIVAPGR